MLSPIATLLQIATWCPIAAGLLLYVCLPMSFVYRLSMVAVFLLISGVAAGLILAGKVSETQSSGSGSSSTDHKRMHLNDYTGNEGSEGSVIQVDGS